VLYLGLNFFFIGEEKHVVRKHRQDFAG
jgi:hypothetical protein